MRKLDLDLDNENSFEFLGTGSYPSDPQKCGDVYDEMKKKVRFRTRGNYDASAHRKGWIESCEKKEPFTPKKMREQTQRFPAHKRCMLRADKMNLDEQGKTDFLSMCMKSEQGKIAGIKRTGWRGRYSQGKPRYPLGQGKPYVSMGDKMKERLRRLENERLKPAHLQPDVMVEEKPTTPPPTTPPPPKRDDGVVSYMNLIWVGGAVIGVFLLGKITK